MGEVLAMEKVPAVAEVPIMVWVRAFFCNAIARRRTNEDLCVELSRLNPILYTRYVCDEAVLHKDCTYVFYVFEFRSKFCEKSV